MPMTRDEIIADVEGKWDEVGRHLEECRQEYQNAAWFKLMDAAWSATKCTLTFLATAIEEDGAAEDQD